MEKLRVLVVDDTILYRKVLSAAVNSTGIAIATHTASNGDIALDHLKKQSFDVVLLDVVMPDMDGLEVLSVIKDSYADVSVIMISGEGPESATNTIAALKKGAFDFIMKPQGDNATQNIAFLQKTLQALFLAIKIKKIGQTPQLALRNEFFGEPRSVNMYPSKPSNKIKDTAAVTRDIDLIVIAASTGGPKALESIVTKLPGNLKQAILIVQHMPKEFTKILANILNQKCQLQVSEARQGDVIVGGQVLIAPGGHHMLVAPGPGNRLMVELQDTPHVNGVRPAADVLFQSVTRICKGKNVLAIILTGMGHDGKMGVVEMKKLCNCYCMVQSEDTCVVYGMPYSVVEVGVADEIVDLEYIGERIQNLCQK